MKKNTKSRYIMYMHVFNVAVLNKFSSEDQVIARLTLIVTIIWEQQIDKVMKKITLNLWE